MKKAIVLALCVVAAWAAPAAAQGWPTRPVTLIVPFAAGGPVDTIARVITVRMSELLGQQIVIENVGGAGGLNGATRASKAAPDGYTMLMSGTAVLTQNPQMQKVRPYDPMADFEHAALFSDSARVLLLRKDFPAKDFAEFQSYSKANQGKMQYGSAGAGSGSHVCSILLDGAMGTRITHVPYRGAGPAMQDLLAGRIDFIAEQISTAMPHIRNGNLKGFVTFGLDRAPGLEDLPTAAELGFKTLDCGAWSSFSFPKGTPKAIVDRLAKVTSDAVNTPVVRDRFKALGVVVVAPERRTPAYLNKFIQSESARWAVPMKSAGLIPQ
ncbi:MAG: tripartite tricarboxylate transporter substrate binding protein BugD [Alphaproteobacteria bacterium]|nr:tripartite tricarboxylate transporter substrate binding protein BugD [Alphaproteobacteria bacterium]